MPALEQLVCETATWCFTHCVKDTGDLSQQTRSEALRPDSMPCKTKGDDAAFAGLTDTQISQVNENRRQRLQIENLQNPNIDLNYCELTGRIYCITYPPRADSPCLEEIESANDISWGFFDMNALPGWDTWISLHKTNNGGIILCGWVPNEIVTPIGVGMSWFRNINAKWLPNTSAIRRITIG